MVLCGCISRGWIFISIVLRFLGRVVEVGGYFVLFSLVIDFVLGCWFVCIVFGVF